MSTLEKLKDLISQDFCHDREDIKPESIFQSDLTMDEVEMDELASLCEKEFSILIPCSALYEIVTVADMVELIDRLKEGP